MGTLGNLEGEPPPERRELYLMPEAIEGLETIRGLTDIDPDRIASEAIIAYADSISAQATGTTAYPLNPALTCLKKVMGDRRAVEREHTKRRGLLERIGISISTNRSK
jgi:hypothetical protein